MWQLDERNGTWSVEDDWKVRVMFSLAGTAKVSSPLFNASQAHDAAVTKVAWAHPEFGTILASSSFDRTVKVWEQTSYSDADSQTNGTSGSRWVERASLIDAKGTVRAVEFAPNHFGLKLVSCLPPEGIMAILGIHAMESWWSLTSGIFSTRY